MANYISTHTGAEIDAAVDSIGDINTILSGKQDTLIFDTTPTENSTRPVTSGGVYEAMSEFREVLDDVNLALETILSGSGSSDRNVLFVYDPETDPPEEFMFEDYPFYLSAIDIPQGPTSLMGTAFDQCYNLKEIVIPEGVEEIQDGAFSDCQSLREIVIPGTVHELSGGLFSSCEQLTTITVNAPEDSIEGAPWGADNAEVIWTGGDSN
jgi:hypothetical protein